MNRKTIIIIAIVVFLFVLAAAGSYFYLSRPEPLKNSGPEENTEKTIENAIKGTLPSLQTNPLEDKPDINPVDKTNPYKNIKTNPFE